MNLPNSFLINARRTSLTKSNYNYSRAANFHLRSLLLFMFLIVPIDFHDEYDEIPRELVCNVTH